MSDNAALVTAFLAHRHAQCPACGYDLVGAGAAACPECGEPVELRIASRRWPAVARAEWTVVGAMLLVSALVNGLCLFALFGEDPREPGSWFLLAFCGVQLLVGAWMLRRWFRMPRGRDGSSPESGTAGSTRIRRAAAACGWLTAAYGVLATLAIGVQLSIYFTASAGPRFLWFVWADHAAAILHIPLGVLIVVAARPGGERSMKAASIAAIAAFGLVVLAHAACAVGILIWYAPLL